MKKRLLIASIVFLVVLTAAAQKKPRVAESFIAAWNSHEVEKVISLFTDDVLYEDVTFGAVNHGPADLRKFAASIFEAFPEVRFELVSSTVNRGHGTDDPNECRGNQDQNYSKISRGHRIPSETISTAGRVFCLFISVS